MAADPMTDALQSIRDYVVDGEPVKPGPWAEDAAAHTARLAEAPLQLHIDAGTEGSGR